jgi:hypothetical protein
MSIRSVHSDRAVRTPPLGIAIRARGPRRDLDHLHALVSEDLVEGGGELGVAVPDEETEGAGPVAEVHEQVAGLLRGPRADRAGGYAEDMHAPGRHLHDEQDVQAPEETVSTVKKSQASTPCA